MKKLILGLALSLGLCASAANTWYVDAKNYGLGGDGSETNPFGSLQEANDAATVLDDDTIMVAEGDYDQGQQDFGTFSHGSTSYTAHVRVKVTKRLNFVASGKRERTVILGFIGDDAGSIYYQASALGCVGVADTASGATFTGITFRNGTHHQSARSGMSSGGIMNIKTSSTATFTAINCLFDRCSGRAGGAMGSGGVAFRCTFTHCGGNGFGTAVYGVKAYNCLFIRNGRTADESVIANGNFAAAVYDSELVNCLIFANGYHNSIRGAANQLYNVAAYDDDDNPAFTLTNGTFRCCALREIMGGDSDADSVVRLFPGVNQESVLSTNLCVNAYTGDYSPVADGFLDGTGESDYRDLSWIPADERNLYFDGTPMPTDAPTPIGLLLPSKEVTSGPLSFGDSKLTVNGKKILKPSLHNAIYQGTWPEQVAIRVAPGETNVTGYTGYGWPRFAGKDVIWQLVPPKHDATGALYAPTAIMASEYKYEYWVDQAYEGAESDGSIEKPFKKLQDAIDVLINYKETLIHVARGTYGDLQGYTAAADAGGVNTRIVVPAYKYAVVFAEEGPEKTFIEGARSQENASGNGTDAVRCIYVNSGADVAFCGFTIKNGHVYGDDDTEISKYCGGAIYCANYSPAFYDCIISGSSGRHAVWNGRYYRCRFLTNDIYRRGVISSSDGNCFLSSSLCANNVNKGGSGQAFFNYVYSFNCSFMETNAPANNVWNINCRCLNAAVYTCGYQQASNSDGEYIGCVGASSKGSKVNFPAPNNLEANPLFINMRQGDYRLSSTSPALNAGKIQAGAKLTYGYLLNYLRGDINNAKLVHDDGTINAGCYADAGVVQPRQMFVSPTGNDENDGLSEDTPKQSLQAACDSATMAQTGYPEDIHEVVALPGTYKIGEKKHATSTFSGAPTIKSRVVVPAGMTLRSRDGAETTIIEGQDATVNVDEYGCGDNALRCAYVETNAKLIGFTLRNGRTRNTTITGYVDDNLGAGAFGHGVANCFVEDCIIEGCFSRNGAAFSHVTAKRCEIRDNCALLYGPVTRTGALEDCYVHDNYGCTALNDLITSIVGCTFVNNYANMAKTDSQPQVMYNCGEGRLVNSVLLGNYRDPTAGAGGATVSISNCVFGSNIPWTHNEGYEPVNCQNTLTFAQLAELYDADGRPLSKDSPSVDNGLAGQTAFEEDVDGNPRVINGTVDIGAFEYDWTPDYEKALGRRVTVTDFTSGVVETDEERVMLLDGAMLAATVAHGSGAAHKDYIIKALVPAGGALTVTLNDEVLGTLTADGSLTFGNALASNELKFEYTGTEPCTVQSIAGNQPMYFIFH